MFSFKQEGTDCSVEAPLRNPDAMLGSRGREESGSGEPRAGWRSGGWEERGRETALDFGG